MDLQLKVAWTCTYSARSQACVESTSALSQRAFAARLHLGASGAVLGVPASALSGRIVALDELWSRAEVQTLLNRLTDAPNPTEAASIMASAIAETSHHRESTQCSGNPRAESGREMVSANVDTVATELGVSERHLRRVSSRVRWDLRPRNSRGLRGFAALARTLARENDRLNWATIAAATGYYDQAHLIEEFRAIAGVTPRALLSELGESL